MTRTITTAILLAGLALPAVPAEQGVQPDTLYRQMPGVFYAAGRSYLGVDIQDVTADRVNALKLKEERGVEITMVDSDAPAGKAGLREHDVILEFNGTAVESEEQLRRLIREVPPGRTVTLAISRDGNPMKINVQLADHSTVEKQSRAPRVIPVPRIRIHPPNGMDLPAFQIQTYSSVLGIQTENLTRQLGEYFGVKDGEGVLVRSVEKGSAAEKAGLKAGDVIVRADNEKLTDRTDLSYILRNHRGGGKMTLVVMRDKKEQTIQVTLPDRGSRDSSLLDLDSEELMASLGNLDAMVLDLQGDDLQGIGDDLASLRGTLKVLELDQQGKELLDLTPELENAIREAEKALHHLKIGSDPI
jgi:C-terminal processing protease CtpA/Prc